MASIRQARSLGKVKWTASVISDPERPIKARAIPSAPGGPLNLFKQGVVKGVPEPAKAAADIPMYKDHGVVGLFMEGSVTKGGGAENAELRSFVMAKLLWDPRADVKRAIGEFHEAYYGNAAGPMLAYFDLMQQQVRKPPAGSGQHIWIYDSPGAPYLNEEFVSKAAELFRQADAAAENDAVRLRVRKARLGIDYVRLNRAKRFDVYGVWYRYADLDTLQDRWKAFVAGCGAARNHQSERIQPAHA